ncbi:hypothetical protein OC846_000683 [Tilletia horrida]|uniref:Histone deacetylase complex subunit SAP30 Sin3 binding domain-containing protein n=1 Tax=Tilletia horrida TaxID=155126 RepID=A0AAN6JUK5_9BASI|nr:hypothetical protein OC845_000817 [Tilletia horrida]KAK0557232.1 hypothetical protein OC846_000683 [Tilletia horrida]KAK0569738.1 hypothetical protein OC861_000574 [Tilletia horrida]
MSKAASAAAAAAAAAAASAAAAREAAEEQARLPPREIDFSTFSDEALHAYVTHYKLTPHYPPRALFTSAVQCSSVPRVAATPSDEDDDSAERGSDQDDDDDGEENGDDEDEDQIEGRPPRKRRRKRHNQSRRETSASAPENTNSSLISTAHILPNGGPSRKRAAAVAAAAAVTASSLTGSSAAGVGDNNGPAPNMLGEQDRYGTVPLEEPDPEDAAALEQLADGTAARAYLSQAVRRHFDSLPAPKEGEVVVGFLYRAKIRDKVLKIADYAPA